MRKKLILSLLSIAVITIVGLYYMKISLNRQEIIVNQDTEKSTEDRTQIAERHEKKISEDSYTLTNMDNSNTDTLIDFEKLQEYMNLDNPDQLNRFKNPEDMKKLITKMKEKMDPETLSKFEDAQQAASGWLDQLHGIQSEDRMPELDMQEFYDRLAPTFGEMDLSKVAMEIFRKQFPEGEPSDYEEQMAERIHKIVAETPGEFEQVVLKVVMKLATDQEYTAWTMGQFQGKIGNQLEWLKEEIIAAGQLEDSDYPISGEMLNSVSTKNKEKHTGSVIQRILDNTANARTRDSISKTEINEDRLVKSPETESIQPLSPEKKALIRKTLTLHGPEQGILHLLKTDKEAADWLMKNYRTSDEIGAWINDQSGKSE